MKIEMDRSYPLSSDVPRCPVPHGAIQALDQYFFGDRNVFLERPVLPDPPQIEEGFGPQISTLKFHSHIISGVIARRLGQVVQPEVSRFAQNVGRISADLEAMADNTKNGLYGLYKEALPQVTERMRVRDRDFFEELDAEVGTYLDRGKKEDTQQANKHFPIQSNMEGLVLSGLGTAHIMLGYVTSLTPSLWKQQFDTIVQPREWLDVISESYPFLIMLSQLDLSEFVPLTNMLTVAKAYTPYEDGRFREMQVAWSDAFTLVENDRGKINIAFSQEMLEELKKLKLRSSLAPNMGCPGVPMALHTLHTQWMSILEGAIKTRFDVASLDSLL